MSDAREPVRPAWLSDFPSETERKLTEAQTKIEGEPVVAFQIGDGHFVASVDDVAALRTRLLRLIVIARSVR